MKKTTKKVTGMKKTVAKTSVKKGGNMAGAPKKGPAVKGKKAAKKY